MALKPDNNETRQEKLARQAEAEQEALLREVDDAVRQGDTEQFIDRWGKPLLGLFLAGIAGFGGYLFWDSRQEAAMERDSEVLVGAIDQVEAGNLGSGYTQLEELAAKDGSGAGAAAAMLRAGIAAEQGRTDDAAQGFADVAANDAAPQAWRDLATIREVALRYDKLKATEVVSRLQPLAVPGTAFFASAGELVAHAYLDQNKRDEAGALFAQIAKDDTAPESTRARARQMAGVLGVDAIEDVNEVLDEQPLASAVTAGGSR